MWILLDNNRSNIRIGVIYVPQENKTSNNELEIMYNNISQQISVPQEQRQQVIILGDFYAKVGKKIDKNDKKYDLVIINKEKEVCKRLWTRVQHQERSILDYVLTNSKLLSTVTEMIVDETKQYRVCTANEYYSSAVQLEQKNKKNTSQIKFLVITKRQLIKLLLQHSLCK